MPQYLRLALRCFFAALRFGRESADALVSYHRFHGGISRQEKFKYFVGEIVKIDPRDRLALENELVAEYGQICWERLRQCPEIPGVGDFLSRLPTTMRKYVVSGGAQTEVRQTLRERRLDQFFALILGNPKSKEENMRDLLDAGSLEGCGAYFGDARLDMELAEHFGLDFVFVSGASEWAEAAVDFHGQKIFDFSLLYEQD